jgi:hypothetical protein
MALFAAIPAFAQSPTGTISGHIVDATGLALPGVTVTLASPQLQGVRATTSSGNGDYVFPMLPPGTYSVTFELSGFQGRTRSVDVAAMQAVPVNATLAIAAVKTTVEVVGHASGSLATPAQGSTTFKQELIASLPNNRTLDASLLLAPSVHPSGPRRAFSTAGSTSFENLFLVNGVVVNENLGGQALPLYIEDAIQETTISTSGISAEYGRFGGAVVNVVTKSGGNLFGGSFRDTLYNDNWRTLTPYERQTNATKTDKVVPTYEFTFGGPVVKDRLWFFTAGRFQNQQQSLATKTTNVSYVRGDDTKRYEGKATYSPASGQTLKGSFSKITELVTNDTQFNVMDANSLYNDRIPQDLLSLAYTGVVRPNLFVEAQYSSRHFRFVNVGSPTTDLINGTLLVDNQRGGQRYWAPTFCGACDAEKRDNDDLFVKGSYFLSAKGTGSHDMVFGYDTFNDKRFVNNHQSGSDYRILGTTSIVQGTSISPVFLGNDTTTIQYNPILVSSQGTNFREHSLFYNDTWRPTARLGVNLGIRWDKNHGVNGAGQLVSTSATFSPRAGVVWDPKGDGVLAVSASFGKYAASLANSVADSSSTGGQVATYRWFYQGPSINASSAGTLVDSAAAIKQVFDWFSANGGLNRPPLSASVPGVSTKIAGSLESPSVLEYAGGVSRQLGRRAALRVDGTYRTYRNFYASVVDMTTGRVTDQFGKAFDLSLVQNTDAVQRKYAGVATSFTYRGTKLNAGASYTLSHAWGNFDGEASNGSGPSTTSALAYPEYKDPAWNNPQGDLAVDQRHRMNAWATYAVPFLTGFSVSGLQSVASGVPYGAAGSVNAAAFVTNPGYVTAQGGGGVTYYFTGRDAFRTATTARTDVAANYAFMLNGVGRKTELFVQAQVLNVLNQFQLCGCGDTVFKNGGGVDLTTIDQSVLTRSNSAALQAFNPFTTTPVEGANWALGPNFGKALSRMAYTSPRTLRVTFGVRF